MINKAWVTLAAIGLLVHMAHSGQPEQLPADLPRKQLTQQIALSMTQPTRLWMFTSQFRHDKNVKNDHEIVRKITIKNPSGKIVDQLRIRVEEPDATAKLIFQDVNGDGMRDMFVQTDHGARNRLGMQFISSDNGKFTAVKLHPSYLAAVKRSRSLLADYMTDTSELEADKPQVVAPGQVVYRWVDTATEGAAVCATIQNNLLVPVVEIDFMNYAEHSAGIVDVTLYESSQNSKKKYSKYKVRYTPGLVDLTDLSCDQWVAALKQPAKK